MSQTTEGTFDPYYRWLGISPNEQPPNHYRLLAIEPFEDDPQVVENAADQRMGHLRTFQTGKHAEFSQKLLNEVAAAKLSLLNREKKAAYDELLRQELQADDSPAEASDTRIESDGPPVGFPAEPDLCKVGPELRATTGRRRAKLLFLGGSLAAVVLLSLGLFISAGAPSAGERAGSSEPPSPRSPSPTVTPAAPSEETPTHDTNPVTQSPELDPVPAAERPVFEKPVSRASVVPPSSEAAQQEPLHRESAHEVQFPTPHKTLQEHLQQAQATLKTNPDAADAHLVLGRWYCFGQGQWKQGFAHLAKCSDDALKAIAQRELTSPPNTANDQVKLGDAWWDLALAREADEKNLLMLRAGYWYRRALPALTSAIAKAKVRKRLSDIANARRSVPGQQSPKNIWSDVL